MLRHLLTLLALITGLAAIGAPAHARMDSVEGVQVEASGSATAQCQTQAYFISAELPERAAKRRAEAPVCLRAAFAILIPTVHIGPDRARE